jgi:thiamine pyrophosphate-dependent acetolactate synthase large subunit-like protein
MADFAGVFAALGGLGLRARNEAEYTTALAEALAAPGPVLVDVLVDPASYPAQIKALRG